VSTESVDFSGSEDFVATDAWDVVCAVLAEARSGFALTFSCAVGADVFGVASVAESVPSGGSVVGEVFGLSGAAVSALVPLDAGSSVSVAEGDGLSSAA
jgi:uncharacterized protein (DUF169 family)